MFLKRFSFCKKRAWTNLSVHLLSACPSSHHWKIEWMSNARAEFVGGRSGWGSMHVKLLLLTFSFSYFCKYLFLVAYFNCTLFSIEPGRPIRPIPPIVRPPQGMTIFVCQYLINKKFGNEQLYGSYISLFDFFLNLELLSVSLALERTHYEQFFSQR